MPKTTYHVSDELGVRAVLRDTERAERLSRAGLEVTAVTEGRDA